VTVRLVVVARDGAHARQIRFGDAEVAAGHEKALRHQVGDRYRLEQLVVEQPQRAAVLARRRRGESDPKRIGPQCEQRRPRGRDAKVRFVDDQVFETRQRDALAAHQARQQRVDRCHLNFGICVAL